MCGCVWRGLKCVELSLVVEIGLLPRDFPSQQPANSHSSPQRTSTLHDSQCCCSIRLDLGFPAKAYVTRDDYRAMNISSSVNLTQLSTTGTQGGEARQDYGIAVAMKIKDQVKQEGENAVKLIESAPAPASDSTHGKNIAAYA